VEKVSDDVYLITDGIFTSCSQKVPDWSFKLGQARIEAEGYARVRNASMRAKNVPFFYTPYILWPTKRERTSGLLVPNFGYSDRRGASLGLAYFQTLGRSYDTTFHVDTYTEGFLGLGNEFRYQPSEGTRGNVMGYIIRDPEALPDQDEWRWKLEWNTTTTDLPLGMRGGVALQDFSDFQFFRDFERDFDRNTLRFIDSRAFMSGNWGPHLLNVLVNDRETFITQQNTVDQRKLPEIEYRLRSTRIGKTPLYAQFEGSAAYLDLTRPDSYSGAYGRIDAFPQLSLPVRTFPWLNLRLTAGGRMTYYSDSLSTEPDQPQAFDGEALTRTLPYGNAQIIGPSFSRIFQSAFGFSRLKHVIEPRWTYTYLGEFEEQRELPLFDEVDQVFSNHSGRFALVNRLLGKVDEKGTAREILSVELARNYSFDEEQPLQSSFDRQTTSSAGPLEASVRWNPGAGTTLRAEANYSTLFSGLQSTELSTNFNLGGGAFAGLTYFTRFRPELPSQDRTLFNQLRVNGGFNVIPRKLRLEGQVNYDLEEQFLQQQRYIINWAAQCYGLRLEWRDFRAGTGPAAYRDKDFRFSLTLKNVGTFLDLTSRSSTQEP
jgi:LPS-assembly protein